MEGFLFCLKCVFDFFLEELSTTDLAEELVEKLEFFKVNQEKISNLKLTAVKIEVRTGTGYTTSHHITHHRW